MPEWIGTALFFVAIGLTAAKLNEMLDFGDGVVGLALNLEETEVGAIILGDYTGVHEGQEVRTTGRLLQVPVGKALLGRVVDTLGQPVDGKGPIEAVELEREDGRVSLRSAIVGGTPAGALTDGAITDGLAVADEGAEALPEPRLGDWVVLREELDYVVVHELAHLRWRGHGPRFWGLVERFVPDADAHRRWLRLSHRGLQAALD